MNGQRTKRGNCLFCIEPEHAELILHGIVTSRSFGTNRTYPIATRSFSHSIPSLFWSMYSCISISMLIIESGTIRLRIEALSSLGRHRSLYRLLVSFMIFALVYSNQIWHETHRSIWTSTLGFLARLGSPRIGAAKWRCIPIQGTSSSSVEANFVGRWNALTCITERLS